MSKGTGAAKDRVDILIDYPEGYGSLAFNPRDSLPYSESLRKMIVSAENSIRIGVPFVDDYGLNFLLSCVAANPNKPHVELVVRNLPGDGIEKLRQSNVYLYVLNEDEHRWGFHAKYMIFDDKSAVIGSENLTERNMKRSLEIGILVGTAISARLLHVHKNLLAISRAIE